MSNKVFRYFRYYGGIKEILRSPYLIYSTIFSLFLFPIWTNENWWELVIIIQPSIIGFSLAGYAILLTFGNEEFLKLIRGRREENETSPYMMLSSTFFHFLFIQIIAIFAAILFKSFYHPIPCLVIHCFGKIGIDIIKINNVLKLLFWFIGFTIFIYSLSLAIAAINYVLKTSELFDDQRTNEIKKENP